MTDPTAESTIHRAIVRSQVRLFVLAAITGGLGLLSWSGDSAALPVGAILFSLLTAWRAVHLPHTLALRWQEEERAQWRAAAKATPMGLCPQGHWWCWKGNISRCPEGGRHLRSCSGISVHPLPNKRLKLAGGDRSKGSGMLCPWRGTDCVPQPCAGGRVARSLSAIR